MDYKTIQVEKKENILSIRLIREKMLNPLDIEGGRELNEIIDHMENDETVRCTLISGSGKSFSAGGDIKGMLKSVEDGKPDVYMDDLTRKLYDIALKLRRSSKPVVASVNGFAMGAGMNLALACDFIVASDDARFSQSFCKLALIPGFGGTFLLSEQVPWQKAAEIAFLGDFVSAGEMKELGFVNKVVAPADLESESWSLAKRLAEGPTAAFGKTKQLFLHAGEHGFEAHLQYERRLQVESARTEDFKIGVKALNERKPPRFTGK